MASKYDKAVDRARAGAGSKEEETALAAAPVADAAGMLVSSDSDVAKELAAKLKSGEWEQAPQLLSLQKGQTLIAMLEGYGPDAEFTDEATGEVTYEKTYVLSKNGVRVSILGSVQLNKKLPPFFGGDVSITRGEDVRNGTRLYTDYLVMGPRRADGQPRNWASAKQLPESAGAVNANTPSKA